MQSVQLDVHKDLGYVTIGAIRQAEKDLEFETHTPQTPVPGGFPFRWICVAEVYHGDNLLETHRLTYLSNSETPIIESFYDSLKRYDGIATHYILHGAVRES